MEEKTFRLFDETHNRWLSLPVEMTEDNAHRINEALRNSYSSCSYHDCGARGGFTAAFVEAGGVSGVPLRGYAEAPTEIPSAALTAEEFEALKPWPPPPDTVRLYGPSGPVDVPLNPDVLQAPGPRAAAPPPIVHHGGFGLALRQAGGGRVDGKATDPPNPPAPEDPPPIALPDKYDATGVKLIIFGTLSNAGRAGILDDPERVSEAIYGALVAWKVIPPAGAGGAGEPRNIPVAGRGPGDVWGMYMLTRSEWDEWGRRGHPQPPGVGVFEPGER
jgi:hypothetical protein